MDHRRPLANRFGRMRRLAAATLVLTLGTSACGASTSDGVTTGPFGSGGPGSTTTLVPGIPPTTGLPADQIVWRVFSGGGFVPYAVYASQVPAITVYGDGTVLVADYEGRDQYDHPVAIRRGTLAPEDLARFVTTVQESGIVDADVDFGDPQVTDLPGTSVTFQGTGAIQQVDVYALDYEDAGGGLSRAEQQRRTDLSELIDTSYDLVTDNEPWTPERIVVIEVSGYDGGPDLSSEAADWPGLAFAELYPDETPSKNNCAVVEGADAETVLRAADDNPTIEFTDGTETRSLVVRPVLPGGEACPEPDPTAGGGN